MDAPRSASRVRWRRAAPALDPERCAGVGHRTGFDSARLRSEGVNESGMSERAVQTRPIKAQCAAVARATASVCNAEWVRLGGTSGHVGFVHTFSLHRSRSDQRQATARGPRCTDAQAQGRCRRRRADRWSTAQAGRLDDGRHARKHACRHDRALRCVGKSIHWSVCSTVIRYRRRVRLRVPNSQFAILRLRDPRTGAADPNPSDAALNSMPNGSPVQSSHLR